MARTQVGRPPHGDVPKARSETAKRAYIAGRLAHRSGPSFLDEIGVALNVSAVSRAGRALLWHPPHYNPRGRKPKEAAPRGERATDGTSPSGALREWLDVDAGALDIGAALVTVDFESQRQQRSAYRDLRGVAGVVQLVAPVRGDQMQKHRLLAMVLVDGEGDRRRLRERLSEVDGDWAWQDIALQTVEPAVRTWSELTRIAAHREGLSQR